MNNSNSYNYPSDVYGVFENDDKTFVEVDAAVDIEHGGKGATAQADNGVWYVVVAAVTALIAVVLVCAGWNRHLGIPIALWVVGACALAIGVCAVVAKRRVACRGLAATTAFVAALIAIVAGVYFVQQPDVEAEQAAAIARLQTTVEAQQQAVDSLKVEVERVEQSQRELVVNSSGGSANVDLLQLLGDENVQQTLRYAIELYKMYQGVNNAIPKNIGDVTDGILEYVPDDYRDRIEGFLDDYSGSLETLESLVGL